MSSGMIPFLPEELQKMSLNDLFQSDDVDISKKGNKVKITKNSSDSVLCLEYTQYPHGKSLSASQIDTTGSKKSRKATVKQMRKEGKTQQEIARLTQMSQSYVSMLLKNDD